jgi:hypothetical protein
MLTNANWEALLRWGAFAQFLIITASWVWHDARRRGARKPLFAAVLAIFLGPVWLAFYLADRPLCADERREGGFGWNFARNSALAWSMGNAPLVLITLALALVPMTDVPASDETRIVVLGILTWSALPALVALAIGWMVRRADVIEQGGIATGRARLTFRAMYLLAAVAFWGMTTAAGALLPPA